MSFNTYEEIPLDECHTSNVKNSRNGPQKNEKRKPNPPTIKQEPKIELSPDEEIPLLLAKVNLLLEQFSPISNLVGSGKPKSLIEKYIRMVDKEAKKIKGIIKGNGTRILSLNGAKDNHVEKSKVVSIQNINLSAIDEEECQNLVKRLKEAKSQITSLMKESKITLRLVSLEYECTQIRLTLNKTESQIKRILEETMNVEKNVCHKEKKSTKKEKDFVENALPGNFEIYE